MSNLALALYQQYESGRAEDLTQAITAARAALALTPGDHPDHAMYALNLAILLRARAAASNDRTYLDEAIESAKYAVALVPEKHPDRAASLSTLGRAHRLRYRVLHTPETPRSGWLVGPRGSLRRRMPAAVTSGITAGMPTQWSTRGAWKV